jgi:Putative beta-barrel porin-2, OmpL-like. bbp2
MFALGVFSVIVFISVLILVYCFIGFGRELSSKRGHASNVTRLSDHPGTTRNKSNISRITIAGLSLVLPTVVHSQTSSNAPLPVPTMAGLPGTASPKTFDAGPLGKLNVAGVLSGFGSWQGYPNPGDKAARADVSNAQILIQKANGLVQYFLEAGVYNIPVLGTPSLSTRNTVSDFFGPLPQAYLKIVPKGNFSFLIGKLPTLIGAEDTFTFENLNIERGLLWNQENAINRGVQVNYTKGRLSGSLVWGDGFYSDRYNWLSGALTDAINSTNSVEFVAGGNCGQTAYSNMATPLYQNNSDIYDLSYTHTAKRWMIEPYLQYTYVPKNARLGVGRATATLGGAILGSYTFTSHVSLAERAEYIDSTGNPMDGAVNLLYGPGSSAWSITVTPAFQKKAFFMRGDVSFAQAINPRPGDAFGVLGRNAAQARGMIETGFSF